MDSDLSRAAERLAHEPLLTLLVNNAGFGTKGRFWEAPLETQEQMHKLHVMATVRLTHAALNNMVTRDLGGIVNVSSVAAYIRSQGSVSYCATKTWMSVFTEGLYLDLKGAGSSIVVQALCPGFTYSEFHDTMELSRERLAPRAFWMTAEQWWTRLSTVSGGGSFLLSQDGDTGLWQQLFPSCLPRCACL